MRKKLEEKGFNVDEIELEDILSLLAFKVSQSAIKKANEILSQDYTAFEINKKTSIIHGYNIINQDKITAEDMKSVGLYLNTLHDEKVRTLLRESLQETKFIPKKFKEL